jgi:general secretion pathway protein G
MKKSFTMMELIFVIVVIGILAAIAIPRLWVTRTDALYVKARTQIATIRAGISSMYSKNVMAGEIDVCPYTEKSTTDNTVFENVINPPIKVNQSEINWTFDGNSSEEFNYTLKIGDLSTKFVYELNASKNCPFTCNESDKLCQLLTQ